MPPPSAIDIEDLVLGTMLIYSECIPSVMESINSKVFYRGENEYAFHCMEKMYINDKGIDPATVVQQLKKDGTLANAGGAFRISQLTNPIASDIHIDQYCKILLQSWIKREQIRIGSMLQRQGFDATTDAFDTLDHIQTEVDSISKMIYQGKEESIETIVDDTITHIHNARKSDQGITGIRSGFLRIDRFTGGWHPGNFIVLAARPGMGKTALMIGCAIQTYLDYKIPIAIFSMEMSSQEIMTRILSMLTEINLEDIMKGRITDEQEEEIKKASKLFGKDFVIDDTPALTALQLRNKIKRYKAKYGIRIAFVDYIQLMQGSSSQGSREAVIGNISRNIKRTAKEEWIPIVALSQLSRATESRGGEKKPQLSDLRDSGSIEQDADQVIFIYRPEYYGIKEDDNGNDITGLAKIMFAKFRNGRIGDLTLKWLGRIVSFKEIDDKLEEKMENYKSPVPDDDGF